MTKNPKIYNVLFLCTGNSARSILAEALIGRLGEGRFRGFSAGSHPKGAVHPLALELLQSLGYPTEGYRSKGWEEFARSGAPELDFVFPVCDEAAAEGDELTNRNAFRSTYRELENRIRLFCEGVPVPRNPL